jgi:hypothetical protein
MTFDIARHLSRIFGTHVRWRQIFSPNTPYPAAFQAICGLAVIPPEHA